MKEEGEMRTEEKKEKAGVCVRKETKSRITEGGKKKE